MKSQKASREKCSTERATGPTRTLVAGAGGFIGSHLVNRLKAEGNWVRGVDLRYPQFSCTTSDEFHVMDLRSFDSCLKAATGVDEVYQLAADMGGIGYISENCAHLTRNNVLINSHMLEAARIVGVDKYLYASSACVYPHSLQDVEDAIPLKEAQAIPADPERGYGWEKLFSEQMTAYYHEEFGLNTNIVRFHNIYGPLGTYEGGKEKAPAAICRKVALAEDGDNIEIWGDGQQTRSFCYIADCIEGMLRIMKSDYVKPINLGTDELVTIDDLVDSVCKVAGKSLLKVYNVTKHQGVRGRNSDNSLLKKLLGWEPQISLCDGIKMTYEWIDTEITRARLSDL